MDKVTKSVRPFHSFYCDECGDLIMELLEYDDGYYESFKKFYLHGIYLKGNYCKECGKKKIEEATLYLKSMGFDV